MNSPALPRFRLAGASVLLAAVLAACGSDNDEIAALPENPPAETPEATPVTLSLEKIGGFATGEFDRSAAEITAYDAGTKRAFVVNALAGGGGVVDRSDPSSPVKAGAIVGGDLLAGAEINSVAVHEGLVAVALQAPVKTDRGRLVLYRADDLGLL